MLKSLLLSTMIMCVNALPVIASYQDTITGSNDVNNTIEYDNATNIVTFNNLHLYNTYDSYKMFPNQNMFILSTLQIDTDFSLFYNLNDYTYKIALNSVAIYNPYFESYIADFGTDILYGFFNIMDNNRFERNYPTLDINIFTINLSVADNYCNYTYFIGQSMDTGTTIRSQGSLHGVITDPDYWPDAYVFNDTYDWFSDNQNFFVSFRRQAIDFVTSYNSGYQIGYSDGYTDGNANDGTATEIFDGILSIGILPVNFFLSIFNFEVFGINIGGIVAALLSVTLIIILVKMVLGGKNG